MRMIDLINSLIDRKKDSGFDQGYKYTPFLNLTTRGKETKEEMYVYYYSQIDEEYKEKYEKMTRLMHDVSNQMVVSDLKKDERDLATALRRAKYLFSQDRREYNSEDDYDEETYNEILKKSEELTEILNREINFDNPSEVYNWVQEMIPYINIQPVTANGIDKPIDKYLLEILEKHGYTKTKESDITPQNVCKNLLANQIAELEKYGFFVSEYSKSQKECERLTSSKVKEIAILNYHKELYNVTAQRIEYLDNGLKSLKTLRDETEKQIKENSEVLIEEREKLIKELNGFDDLSITSKIYKTEELEAKTALENVEANPNKENIDKMFDLISRLHDKEYKERVLYRAYVVLDAYREQGKINSDMMNFKNHTVGKPKKEDIEKRIAKIEKKLIESNETKEEIIKELYLKEYILVKDKNRHEVNNARAKRVLAKVTEALKAKGYIDTTPEFKKIDLSEYENDKVTFIDKIKKLFTKKNDDEDYVATVDESDETLIDFVPIENISEANSELKGKLYSERVKDKISNGLNYLVLVMKSSAKEIGFYIGGVVVTGLSLYSIDKNLDLDNTKVDTIEISEDINYDESIYDVGQNIEINSHSK